MTRKHDMLVFQLSDAVAEREISDPEHLHIFRCGVLVRLLMLLEAHGVNRGNQEVDALREIRNAVIHNDSDLSKNRNNNSTHMVQTYHADLVAGKVQNATPGAPHLEAVFSLSGSIVKFDVKSIGEYCRQVYRKHVP